MHTVLTGTAETSRPSPRNGFTAYTCSPRGGGLSCPRCRRNDSCQRSARVAAPGPHDFAVRCERSRPVKRSPDAAASIASRALRIVTIAKRPSVGTGRASYALDCYFCKAEYFSLRSLTRFRQTDVICPSCRICHTSATGRTRQPRPHGGSMQVLRREPIGTWRVDIHDLRANREAHAHCGRACCVAGRAPSRCRSRSCRTPGGRGGVPGKL